MIIQKLKHLHFIVVLLGNLIDLITCKTLEI